GYPSEIINGLLYNINLTNKSKRLYILKNIVATILSTVYNEKYYFSRNCIFYNFKDYIIVRKTY
ncbi:hypothetical protein QR685DRAFT_433125, partial [Neurospora intermedia]